MKQQPQLLSEQVDSDTPNYSTREYLVSRIETEDKVTERFKTVVTWNGEGEMDEYYGKEWSRAKTFTTQKFLCINGPLKNTKVTEEKGAEYGYVPYNNASWGGHQKRKTPKVILVLFAD